MPHDIKAIGDAIRAAVDAALSQRFAEMKARVDRGLRDVSGVEQRIMQTVIAETCKWAAVEKMLGDVVHNVQRLHSTYADQISAIAESVAAISSGIDGKDGRDGLDGKDGAPGTDGRDGRDALELEILDGIDPQKAYPRGTVAAYRGGLIKATRRTGPIGESLSAAGWRVILRGVAQTEVVPSDDLRTLGIRLTHTDGEVVEQTLRSPSLLYRGVFREGDQYDGGDAVTFGGSLWVALRATTTKPGDGSPDWRLAVKKGRDGRDAK